MNQYTPAQQATSRALARIAATATITVALPAAAWNDANHEHRPHIRPCKIAAAILLTVTWIALPVIHYGAL